MRYGDIDVPDELLDAQAAGRLAVFAGSGVSKSPPSNLPDFDELVSTIEAGAPLKRRTYGGDVPEEPDVYLGRVDDAGFPVHNQVATTFASASAHNAVHSAIVDLFKTQTSLKVVTTNYDKLLSIAAKHRWPDGMDETAAPALPLAGC